MSNVSEITRRVKEIIQDNPDLQDVWIRGKISKVEPTRSGTLNFTLTDRNKKIECVIFNESAPLQENLPPIGSNMSVKGQIYVYDTRSEYRFKVTDRHRPGDSSPPQPISISALMKTLKSTLEEVPPIEIQGEIAEVFKSGTGYTILKLKDVTMDEQVNEIIECKLPREIDPPFRLCRGERITVEGKLGTFTDASTYQINIDNSNGLRKWSVPGPPLPNTCQECGQLCEQRYPLCPICYYAQVYYEGIVVGAVMRYFDSPRFANFATQREYEIRFGVNIMGRADVVLLNSEGNPVAIAECKRIEYDGNDGIVQLEGYINPTVANLGLFADNTDPYEWTFLRRNDERNRYDEITRAQFERELGVAPAPEIPPTKTQFELVHGNIIKSGVDAIVNAADPSLTRGTGVDGAIRDEGGEEIDRECQEIFDREGVCPPGKAVITTGGDLPARYVIHAVGPIWQGGNRCESESLADCYRSSLQLAVENGIRSIAFAAISTGNFGFPIEKATPIALNTVKDFVEQAHQNNEMVPERIQFVLFDEEAYACYVKELSNLGFGLSCQIG